MKNLIKIISVSSLFICANTFANVGNNTSQDAAAGTNAQNTNSSLSSSTANTQNANQNDNQNLSDTTITRNVKQNLARDKRTSNANVNVETRDGVVFLGGKIAADNQADDIIEVVESTAGVKDVDESKLDVNKSKHEFKDSAITAKVKGTFIREELFGKNSVSPMSIHVETVNGKVFLTGTADNQAQIDTAKNLAKSVKGVVDVDSKVTVKQ